MMRNGNWKTLLVILQNYLAILYFMHITLAIKIMVSPSLYLFHLIKTLHLRGYVSNSIICWLSDAQEDILLTNFVLVAIWRTRCNKPRIDAVVFCLFERRCYRVFNFVKWMNGKYTNPSVLLPMKLHVDIATYANN